MADKDTSGTKTTGNVDVDAINPGGTHGKPATGTDGKRAPVESGDRNEMGKEPEKGPREGGKES